MSLNNTMTGLYNTVACGTPKNKLNDETFLVENINDKGLSFLKTCSSLNECPQKKENQMIKKISSPFKPKTTRAKDSRNNLNKSYNLDLKTNTKTNKKKDIDSKVRVEMINLEIMNNKISDHLINEVDSQRRKFEDNRKMRDFEDHNMEKKRLYLKRKGSKFEKILKNYVSGSSNNEKETIQNFLNYAENKIINNENLLHKEIEEFLKQNIEEFDCKIKEIKLSYEEDLSRFDDNDGIYSDVIKNLKDEMNKEIETTKQKYEFIKNNEIEKIKAKYLK